MANDDYLANYGWSWSTGPEGPRTSTDQQRLVESVADLAPAIRGDEHALDLIDNAFFNMDIGRGERDLARAEAAFYFEDEFDIDLFDVWDYDDYRDWYDAA